MRSQQTRDGLVLYYSNMEIEERMEAALRRSGLIPTLEAPVTPLDRFIEQYLGVVLDEWAELDADLMGQTDFTDRPIRISINRRLTEEADHPGCHPGLKGRRRATLAHEAAHVLLHEPLCPSQHPDQENLFEEEPPSSKRCLQRCFARDIFPSPGRPPSDWREVQANKGMAALLMPRPVFCEAACQQIRQAGWSEDQIFQDSPEAQILTVELARFFQVSRQACEIRLRTLNFLHDRSQPRLAGF